MSEIHQDPFTDHVVQNLPPDVRATFTPEQLAALQGALARVQKNARARHLVDLRVGLPLYWASFYLVFLFGRDQRKQVCDLLVDRRDRTHHVLRAGLVLVLLGVLFVGFAVVLFYVLYLIKCWLGIDIFPDRHLCDILGFSP